MIKVILADDHDVVRKGIKMILSDDPTIKIVGEAKNGADLLVMASKQKSDLFLIDISMPDMTGLETLSELRKSGILTPVIFLSMHPEERYAVHAMKAGAAGYLTKDCSSDDMLRAVKKAASGGKYITSSLAERLVEALQISDNKPLHSDLSERESQILKMIGSGKTSSEIADALSLSIKTISTYKARIMQKMGLKSSAELIRYAIDNKLITFAAHICFYILAPAVNSAFKASGYPL